ncbi:MAG: hypothetical protein M3O30_11820 [Planctomycetota bacterium]|nr:hypothetical protein [Planctomycetota bacterium]
MSDTSLATPKFIDDGIFARGALGIWTTHGLRARIGLIIAALVSCAIFIIGSRWLEVPPLLGFDGSLFREDSPVAALLSVAVLLFVTTVVGTVIAGRVRFEAGLFAAALGMMCISLRGGTMQAVLLEVNGAAGVYYTMFLELLALGAILVGLWAMLVALGKANFVIPAPEPAFVDTNAPEPLAPGGDLTGNLIALATQVVATIILMMFLCQSEAKDQVLASTALASILGTYVAYMGFPTRPSIWFWTGPLIVGLIGYLIAGAGQNTDLAIGSSQGAFAALARPLPLDYASVGPAAAMLGYWMSRKQVVPTADDNTN